MAFENRYSFADRLLHRLAFATPRLQVDLAEMDDDLLRKKHGEVVPQRPLFITAMPRAGTTLLLDLCAGLDDFACHTYRDMPFVLVPFLWAQVSAGFRQGDAPRERAHADGMMVSADSPEAFEEMLWKAFWPDQYEATRIRPWPDDGKPEFEAFFRRHMAKIVKLRQRNGDIEPRYASKNNFNIARLGWIARAFPDATILVPFREPVEHAASLLRQHRNFLQIHAGDPFARSYMAGIGHFDFGENLKPIDFDGWLSKAERSSDALAFWLEYWTAAYSHCLAAHRADIVLLDYDALCANAAPALGALAERIGLARTDAFAPRADSIKAARAHAPDLGGVAPDILERAQSLHGELRTAGLRF